MADFDPVELPTPPEPSGDGDWGEVLNAAIRTLETNLNTVKAFAEGISAGTLTDEAVAALVEEAGSDTREAVIAAGLQLGTTSTTAAAGDHLHTGVYTTPADVQNTVAAAQAGFGSGIDGAPSSWPATFPPSSHSHTATDISNSTAVGRNVLTASDQQAARAAIGAGTGNGTSNLQLGTTSSTAAAGNHTHPASAITFSPAAGITATNVQAAIEAAAASGGGASIGPIYVVPYSSGAYPAVPTDAPSGTLLRWFIGPVQYTGAAWPGVVNVYTYAALT